MTVNSDANLIAIVGDTNSGKTGFMRGVYCLFLLEAFFLNYSKRSSAVGAEFDDVTVERKASFKKKNNKLTKSSDKIMLNGNIDEPYTKFHRAMPVGVSDATGIKALEIQGMAKPFLLNFIRQSDQVLPDAMSPAQIAKLFASVSGRAKIDNAIRETNKEIKNTQRDHDVLVTELEELDVTICDMQSAMPSIEFDIEGCIENIQTARMARLVQQELQALNAQIQTLDVLLSRSANHDLYIAPTLERYENLLMMFTAGDVIKSAASVQISPLWTYNLVTTTNCVEAYYHMLHIMQEWRDYRRDYDIVVAVGKETRKLLDVTIYDMNALITDEGICPYSGELLPDFCRKALLS